MARASRCACPACGRPRISRPTHSSLLAPVSRRAAGRSAGRAAVALLVLLACAQVAHGRSYSGIKTSYTKSVSKSIKQAASDKKAAAKKAAMDSFYENRPAEKTFDSPESDSSTSSSSSSDAAPPYPPMPGMTPGYSILGFGRTDTGVATTSGQTCSSPCSQYYYSPPLGLGTFSFSTGAGSVALTGWVKLGTTQWPYTWCQVEEDDNGRCPTGTKSNWYPSYCWDYCGYELSAAAYLHDVKPAAPPDPVGCAPPATRRRYTYVPNPKKVCTGECYNWKCGAKPDGSMYGKSPRSASAIRGGSCADAAPAQASANPMCARMA